MSDTAAITADPTAELDEQILRLTTEIADIKDQLADADMRRQADPSTLDRGWQQRARMALRKRKETLAAAQLARQRLLRAALPEAGFKDVLISVCREEFDEEAWQQITAEAQRRHVEGAPA